MTLVSGCVTLSPSNATADIPILSTYATLAIERYMNKDLVVPLKLQGMEQRKSKESNATLDVRVPLRTNEASQRSENHSRS